MSHGRGAVVLLLAVGALGTSVGGCAGAQAGATAEIVGGVYQVGGPMALAATAPPRSPLPGTVTATAKDGTAGGTYRVRTAGDGTFTLHVAPGTYEVGAATDSGGQVRVVEVTVAAGGTATVELDSYVP